MTILLDLMTMLFWSLVFWFLIVVLAVVALTAIIAVGATCYACGSWFARKARQFAAWWRRTYADELAMRRRMCEEDARALGALKLPVWPNP